MVETARQACVSLHGTRGEPLTVASATQLSHWSSGIPSSTPLAVRAGNVTNVSEASVPPTTSQRYHRAPASHASPVGRNHAHDSTERIARLSSAPVNLLKPLSHAVKTVAPKAGSSASSFASLPRKVPT